MLTMPEFAFLALCRLARPLARPGPRCSRVEAGVPFMRKKPSAAPVTTPSNRPSTQRMPSTRSSAATKCISEVPGLAKQTSTPPATNVRTRLSAPFIIPLPFAPFFKKSTLGRSIIPGAVRQRFRGHCSHRQGSDGFFAATPENRRPHVAVPCETSVVMACLSTKLICPTRQNMSRAFALLVAAVALLAGSGHARAQGFPGFPGFQGGFDMREGGPNFSIGASNPIPRQTVRFESQYRPGTILIDTAERRLYLVLQNGVALRYGIGVGRDGFRWGGAHRISAKKEWPAWTPPSQMLARRPDLPRYMPGGMDNPLGARAMYLGSTLYRIHGSNEPETIGQAVSSGCFRMTNDDVTDLYSRVAVGTTVVVKN